MNKMPEILPQKISEQIVEYINQHAAELTLDPNCEEPLGMGIFTVLERLCTVLYYPINDAHEENAAFLLADVPMQNDDIKNIVFVNTFQAIENQVFSAAHELGHLRRLPERLGAAKDAELSERIANRFASELLMPEKMFRQYADELLNAVPDYKEARRIKLSKLLEIIVNLMSRFFVPYEEAVIRMVELGILGTSNGTLLMEGDENTSREEIQGYVQSIVSDSKYAHLHMRSMRKEIKGLADILSQAEAKGLHRPKIAFLRDTFGLHDIAETVALDESSKE